MAAVAPSQNSDNDGPGPLRSSRQIISFNCGALALSCRISASKVLW